MLVAGIVECDIDAQHRALSRQSVNGGRENGPAADDEVDVLLGTRQLGRARVSVRRPPGEFEEARAVVVGGSWKENRR